MTPNNSDKPNFLDRGTLTAFALILLFWFGWSKYMESQNPPPAQQTATQPQAVAPAGKTESSAAQPAVNAGTVAPAAPVIAPAAAGPEKTLAYDDEYFSFEVSSHGMGIKNIDIKKYKTRDNKPVVLGLVKTDFPFATNFVDNGAPVEFQIEKAAPDTFVGRATVGGMQIEKTMKVVGAKYALETLVKVSGNLEGFKGLSTTLSDTLMPEQQGGFLNSNAAEYQDWFLLHDGKKTRKVISPKDGVQLAEQGSSIAALSAHYFTLAVADHSDVLPAFSSNVGAGASFASGRLTYQPMARVENFNVKYLAFAGPKSFEVLSSADENLNQVIDYGFFGALGKPILWLLKFLQTVFGNWGVSIVVLTIIVRAIVLPFNAYAFKSMKAMQRIQPEMNRIKERYKDKPAEAKLQMNQEIMQLMKANNASPIGGCLPTLLQLPVFFALYQVLGQSIELYRAPFIFWIHDLSSKDPFFVLPVLMGITMYLQQKLTPTTMDPQQAKVLQWMPVIFSVFMLSLPSGLTLYIFVSTLFSIIQQYYFMRDKSTTATGRVNEAKA